MTPGRLSPLNFSGLIAQGLRREQQRDLAPDIVTMYRCPHCEELHDYEHDAAECCSEHVGDERGTDCPVCGEQAGSFATAADCCLWKDLDATTRWRIADAVEAGETWAEAIARIAGAHA